jgi:hypothetical protein
MEGVAVLFSAEPVEGGEHSRDTFRERESDDDPVLRAERMRDSCEDDFPTRLWAIAMNGRARELMAARRMRDWGLVSGA